MAAFVFALAFNLEALSLYSVFACGLQLAAILTIKNVFVPLYSSSSK
jgi:hypothetical protein